jgi:hypothetical protein
MTKIYRYALSLALTFSCMNCACFAQALRGGLGDATTIVTKDKTLYSTGNPNSIGDFAGVSTGQDTGDFATRHIRSAESSGIGGSFIGTTNVTAESSPARTGRVPEDAIRALIPTASGALDQGSLSRRSLFESASIFSPLLSPDVSSGWNPSPSAFRPDFSSPSIDFFAGHKKSPASKPNSMGVPSFDSF